MTDSVSQQFDVHLFPVVRLKVSGVHATSPQAAIEKALEQMDLHAYLANIGGEYAEELSHFLVDMVGDEQFSQSRWFYSQQTPLLDNLSRLVSWYDRGRPEAELQQIVRDARDVLTNSI